MSNSYRIEYYREKSKFNSEISRNPSYLEKMRSEFELMDQIKAKFPDIEIVEIFSNFNVIKNENSEELLKINEYYSNNVVKAATNSKVQVSRLFRTHSKRFKIDNFIVIFKNDNPHQVFPCSRENKTFSVIDGLRQFLKKDFDIKEVKKSGFQKEIKFKEWDLQKLLASYPELIEDGLKFINLEVEVEGGSIDCVFKDKNDCYLIIETKLKATDQLTGQILRYATTFMKEYQVENVRKGIACIEINLKRIETFKELGIEIFKIKVEKT
ncbi:MAG: endonuclease NucS domain-containing protein [Candidatus Helarchaeota archaeon]